MSAEPHINLGSLEFQAAKNSGERALMTAIGTAYDQARELYGLPAKGKELASGLAAEYDEYGTAHIAMPKSRGELKGYSPWEISISLPEQDDNLKRAADIMVTQRRSSEIGFIQTQTFYQLRPDDDSKSQPTVTVIYGEYLINRMMTGNKAELEGIERFNAFQQKTPAVENLVANLEMIAESANVSAAKSPRRRFLQKFFGKIAASNSQGNSNEADNNIQTMATPQQARELRNELMILYSYLEGPYDPMAGPASTDKFHSPDDNQQVSTFIKIMLEDGTLRVVCEAIDHEPLMHQKRTTETLAWKNNDSTPSYMRTKEKDCIGKPRKMVHDKVMLDLPLNTYKNISSRIKAEIKRLETLPKQSNETTQELPNESQLGSRLGSLLSRIRKQ